MFWMSTANVAQEQFWKRHSYNLGAVFTMVAQENSRGDTKPLGGFGFALCNFHLCLHILPWLLRLDSGMLKCSWNFAKASAELVRVLAWGKGGMEAMRKFHLVSSFRTNYTSNSFQLQESCDNISTRNLKYWVCIGKTGAIRQKSWILRQGWRIE